MVIISVIIVIINVIIILVEAPEARRGDLKEVYTAQDPHRQWTS